MVAIILMVIKWIGIYLFVGLVFQGITARMIPEKFLAHNFSELFIAMVIWPFIILGAIITFGRLILCWFGNGFRTKGPLH